MNRWHATVYYLTDAGSVDVEHDFDEIEDLHDIVERGPDWHTIDRIVVTLARRVSERMTVEQAETV